VRYANQLALQIEALTSHFLLICEALESTREESAITACDQLFLERGLPRTIRVRAPASDWGTLTRVNLEPSASGSAMVGANVYLVESRAEGGRRKDDAFSPSAAPTSRA
jgi:hypothetical protein